VLPVSITDRCSLTSSRAVAGSFGLPQPSRGLTMRMACILGCVASMRSIPKNRSPDTFITLRSWRRISRRPAHSLMGSSYRVVQRSPSPSSLGSVSTPAHRATCFGSTLPRAEHVPSSWFLTTSTASSTESPAGLLHPTSDHEVHRIAAAPRSRVFASFPTGATPSRAFPSQVAAPNVSAGTFLLAVIGCNTDPTPRPYSTRESVALACRCQPTLARYSLGFPT